VHHFTGKERDSESGNDYFKYRYLASSMGRWLSPDPSGLSHASLGDPQSLDLYNYVGNNPLTRTDLDGLCWKGIQWACNVVQAVHNAWDGYGLRTDAGVERYMHNVHTYLRNHGVSTEGMKDKAAIGLYYKTWQTYRRANLNGGPDYVGRTSGTGTPEENIAKRNSYKPKTGEFGPAELDKSSTNPAAIRGREQQLITANGGAQSQGGTSSNAINGVADSNPNKAGYMGAAESEFGTVQSGASTGAGAAEGAVEAVEILNTLEEIP